MPILQPDDHVTDDKSKAARAAADADCCAARPWDDRPGASCPRGAACHCARPLGHPIPVDVCLPRVPV